MPMEGSLAAASMTARAALRTHFHLGVALGLMMAVCMTATARASSMPVQGVYEYCAPAASPDGCTARLRQIAAGGFKVVLNYAVFQADKGQLQRYMQVAAGLRLKLIWPVNDRPWWGPGSLADAYPALGQHCSCAAGDEFVRYVVGLVSRSPATWGYYVADELAPLDAPAVAAFAHRLRAYDPTHPTLAVAAGDDTVAQLLSPYATAADVLGADTYPIGTGQPLDRVSFIARNVKAVASRTHRRSALVLQAFSWSNYPNVGPWPAPHWPSRAEMRRMRDLAIRAADPSLILWYSYFDIRKAADADRHWRDLVWAAYGT